MALVEHFGELRQRLLVAAVAVAVGAIGTFCVFGTLLGLLIAPYCHVVGPHHACALYVTAPLDGLSIRIKVAAYGGVLLASPVLLWQAWRFVAPGLHRGERRYAVSFVTSSAFFFVAGAVVAWLSFGHALAFLDAVGGSSLHEIYSPTSYIGLLLLMMVAFGVAFELPVLLVFLQLVGVVTPHQLGHWRRWAIVALVTLAAVITPSADPFSMFAMAVPLVAFYEGAIVVGRLVARRRHRLEAVAGGRERAIVGTGPRS
jgi:sec-independent protein translocase protein TatC